MSKSLKKFYVYFARGLEGEILYIGQGSGERYKHCLHGTSSNKALNRYFFQNGEDGCITVEIVEYFSSKEESLKYEELCITRLSPPFNRTFNKVNTLEHLKCGFKVDFCKLLKKYVKAIETGDIITVENISNYSEEHKRYVEVLGIAKIKAIGFHKTKLTNAYNLQVKFNQSNQLIKESLKGLRVGNRYTIKKVLEELKKAYDKVGVKKKPVSTDIKNYFNVKNVWLIDEFGSRCKGYEIISDLYKEDFY